MDRYRVVCDETNNTAETIANNELHIRLELPILDTRFCLSFIEHPDGTVTNVIGKTIVRVGCGWFEYEEGGKLGNPVDESGRVSG